MKHPLIILVALTMFAASLSACSGNASVSISSSSTAVSSSEDGTTDSAVNSTASSTEKTTGLSLEEAQALYQEYYFNRNKEEDLSAAGSFFVQHADHTFDLAAKTSKISDNGCAVLVKDSDASKIPVLSHSAGDSLVFISNSSSVTDWVLATVTRTGHTIPLSVSPHGFYPIYSFYQRTSGLWFGRGNFDSVTMELTDFNNDDTSIHSFINATINNQDYDQLKQSNNALPVEDDVSLLDFAQDSEVNIGYYDGTTYKETTLKSNYTYFILDYAINNGPLSSRNYEPVKTIVPVTLTQNGYAEIDISTFAPGYYVIPVRRIETDIMRGLPCVIIQIVN